MDSSEFYTFEDQAYVNPTLSSGEQEGFINNFRDIQNRNNQQIATDTYNLGKALPSNLGGLGGGESYFNGRYQTDQVNDLVANLKTAAQAQSLNDVMNNYTNQLSRRYSNAQRAYNKRRSSGSGGGGNSLEDTLRKLLDAGKKTTGEVDEKNITGKQGKLKGRLYTSPEDPDLKPGHLYSTVPGGADNRYYYTYDDTHDYNDGIRRVVKTNDPTYTKYGDIYLPNSVYDRTSWAEPILDTYIKLHGN